MVQLMNEYDNSIINNRIAIGGEEQTIMVRWKPPVRNWSKLNNMVAVGGEEQTIMVRWTPQVSN